MIFNVSCAFLSFPSSHKYEDIYVSSLVSCLELNYHYSFPCLIFWVFFLSFIPYGIDSVWHCEIRMLLLYGITLVVLLILNCVINCFTIIVIAVKEYNFPYLSSFWVLELQPLLICSSMLWALSYLFSRWLQHVFLKLYPLRKFQFC